jgi:hypothetical protein
LTPVNSFAAAAAATCVTDFIDSNKIVDLRIPLSRAVQHVYVFLSLSLSISLSLSGYSQHFPRRKRKNTLCELLVWEWNGLRVTQQIKQRRRKCGRNF